MLCLTSVWRSTLAPPDRSSRTTSVSPSRLALMRAVMPSWGTQWDKTVTITCDVTHIETRWKVYTCCEAVNDTSISLAYLSTCTYKCSREEGSLLIISLMSNIRVDGAQPCQHKLLIYHYKRDFQIQTSYGSTCSLFVGFHMHSSIYPKVTLFSNLSIVMSNK